MVKHLFAVIDRVTKTRQVSDLASVEIVIMINFSIQTARALASGEHTGGAYLEWFAKGKEWKFKDVDSLAAYAAKEPRVCGVWFDGESYFPIFDTSALVDGEGEPYAERNSFLSVKECNLLLAAFDAKAKELKVGQGALSAKLKRCNGQLNTKREEATVTRLSDELHLLDNIEANIVRSVLQITKGRFASGRLDRIGHYGDYLTVVDHNGDEFHAFTSVNGESGDEYVEVIEKNDSVTYYEDPNPEPKPPVDTRW